jgi:hypothetical protein
LNRVNLKEDEISDIDELMSTFKLLNSTFSELNTILVDSNTLLTCKSEIGEVIENILTAKFIDIKSFNRYLGAIKGILIELNSVWIL